VRHKRRYQKQLHLSSIKSRKQVPFLPGVLGSVGGQRELQNSLKNGFQKQTYKAAAMVETPARMEARFLE
jgi:hypothetical protein